MAWNAKTSRPQTIKTVSGSNHRSTFPSIHKQQEIVPNKSLSTLLLCTKKELLPGVPTLKRQSWWPQSQTDLLLRACLSAGFSPLLEQFPGEQ